MSQLSDGFIAMPGGMGTLEELFEMLTWSQLGIHSKPVGLLNAGGFYDKLVDFIAHAREEGFIKPQHAAMLRVAEAPALLLQKLTHQ
jgi:uncharacterized protein (TIGR00730 family)